MKAFHELPENYTDIHHIQFQYDKNKKSAICVYLIAALITLLMAGVMSLIVPMSSLLSSENGTVGLLLRLLALIPMILLYVLLHEAIHGIVMKLLGCQKLNYVFSGLYISAGCHEFFTKWAYLLIDLAPVVLLGAVLNLFCVLVPYSWYWIFYLLQILNIAGAAGDYFIAYRLLTFDDSILVCDAGTHVIVYAPKAVSMPEEAEQASTATDAP